MNCKELFKYKGHTAEINTKTTWWAFVPPNGCVISLKSEFLHCRSEDMPDDSAAQVIKNIYKKWFQEKVDKYLENSNNCRSIAL